jgi:hypothetical protein
MPHTSGPSDDYLADIAHQLQVAAKESDAPQLKKILKIAVTRIEVQCRAHPAVLQGARCSCDA